MRRPALGERRLAHQPVPLRTWAPVPLDDSHSHALRDEVLNLAGAVLAKRGFNYAQGAYWKPAPGERDIARPATSEVAVVPTRAYLDLQVRRFGPAI